MNKAERLLWDLDHKLAVQSLKSTDWDRINSQLTQIFRPDWKGVLNGLNSYREAVTLIPKGYTWRSPIEHSERGNYWFDLRTSLGHFRGWSYDYEYSVLRALLSYKIADVKINEIEAIRVANILSDDSI